MICKKLVWLHASVWSLVIGAGCSNEALTPSMSDCNIDGIGCSMGFICQLMDDGQYQCISEYTEIDATLPMTDVMIIEMDARVDIFDAQVPQDSEVILDADGDEVVDSLDNCPDEPNFNQIDSDNDGLGDVCDLEPNIQNFILGGQTLIMGGISIDDDYTIESKITIGTKDHTDGQLILTGEL